MKPLGTARTWQEMGFASEEAYLTVERDIREGEELRDAGLALLDLLNALLPSKPDLSKGHWVNRYDGEGFVPWTREETNGN